jgi:MOSC domain-containing protein YiiM
MTTGTKGRIVAVSTSPTSGVPKYPQDAVVVGPQGLDGDHHAGPINKHKKSGDPEPNRRQVSIVAEEVLTELNSHLGIELKPGDLAENILVAGLGDLGNLQEGDRLSVGPEVVLEVTGQNRPCDVLRVYHADIVVLGKRGIGAVVVTTGTASPGDACRITTKS